jgi:hypothetical protein
MRSTDPRQSARSARRAGAVRIRYAPIPPIHHQARINHQILPVNTPNTQKGCTAAVIGRWRTRLPDRCSKPRQPRGGPKSNVSTDPADT